MQKLGITVFPSRDNPIGEPTGETSWDDVVSFLTNPVDIPGPSAAELSESEEADTFKATLPLWSGSLFDGARSNANFAGAFMMGFDVDAKHSSWAEVEAALRPYAAFAYTTSRSTKAKPRWRAGVLLEHPVTNIEDFRATHAALSAKLKAIGAVGSKDPARQFYFPRVDPEFMTVITEGKPFPVVRGEKAKVAGAADDELRFPLTEDQIQRAAEIIEPYWVPGVRDSLGFNVAGCLAYARISPESAFDLLVQIGDNPEKRARTVSSAYKAFAADSALPGEPALEKAIGLASRAFHKVIREGTEKLFKSAEAMVNQVITESAAAPVAQAAISGHVYKFDPCCVVNGELEPTSLPAITRELMAHKDWHGVLRWNDFTNREEAVNPPMALDAEKGRGISKNDVSLIRMWFAYTFNANAKEEDVRAAVIMTAKRNHYHPVRDWFASLPPVNPLVLDGLAARLFGATDPLEETFLLRFLISAVARIFEPGCQADSALTLYEPKGGMKKSTFVRELFSGPWMALFGKMKLGDLETSRRLQGRWCFEIAEMAGMRDSQIEDIKAFMTTRYDGLRDMWDPSWYDLARQCVFVCTTNDPDILKDEAHERRFWIINVRRMIDIEFLQAHRDAIWSAAYSLYREGVQWWLTPEELADAKSKLDEFKDTDMWEGELADVCRGRQFVTVKEAWAALGGEKGKDLGRAEQMRIAKALKSLGCTKGKNEKDIRGWKPPPGLANAERPLAKVFDIKALKRD